MAHYVIRVRGTLCPEVTDTFPSLTADWEPAPTILHGHLSGQAALAGLLNHLDVLGVDIVEVLQVPADQGTTH